MLDIFNLKDKVVNVLFAFDVIFLIIALFVSSKAYFVSVIVVNLLLTGTFMVINKWSSVYDKIPMHKQLNNLLELFMGGNNGKS